MANETKLTITINADGTAAVRVLEQVEKDAASFTRKVKENWLAISAAAFAAQQAISRAIDFAKLSDKYDQNQRSFNLMVTSMGKDAEAEFAKIREASGGLIDKNALTESANRAISLGLRIESLGQLMEISRAKARDMGITTTQAFSDIATGIGRGSIMILDNLGLTIKIGEANKKYADSINKTVEALTAQEKQQAITNAVIEAGTEAIDRQNLSIITNAERWQLWSAQITDSKVAIGNFIRRVAVGITAAFQIMSAGVLGIGSFIGQAVQTFLSVYLSGISTVLELANPVLRMLTAAAKITDALKLTTGAADKLKETTAFTKLLAKGFADESVRVAEEAGKTGAAWAAAEELTAKAAENIKLALTSQKELNAVQAAAPRPGAGDDTSTFDEKLKERIALLQDMENRATEIGLEADAQALFRLDAKHAAEIVKLNELKAVKSEIAQAELLQEIERAALLTSMENAKLQERAALLQEMVTRATEIGLEADAQALFRLDAKHAAEIEKLEELGIIKSEIAQAEVSQEMERQNLITSIEEAALKKRLDAQKRAAQAEITIRSSVVNAAVGLLNTLADQSDLAAIAAVLLSKGLAVAQAVQFGAAAEIRALAELGPIAGPAAAARIRAWTVANVALIAATGLGQLTGPGGGGSGEVKRPGPEPGGPTGIGTIPEAPEDQEPRIIVNVFNQGSVVTKDDLARDVFDSIQKLREDGLPSDTRR